jgi:serine/threonine protein kinase
MTAPQRYHLLGQLGTGGMAEIWLARMEGPGGFERLLAVKKIRPEHAQDPGYVRMLIDEARNAALLSHHHIVQVFDIELRDGAVLYAMEYLHGQTLANILIRAGKLPLDTAISIGVAVAAGLHHAHERPVPIIHRDVAPSNVMLTYEGNIKLIDFGIAKSATNMNKTQFGMFKGRLAYASPEQRRCEPVDRRADIYSLGVMLYELTTGRRAFSDDGPPAVEDPKLTPPRALDPGFPAELEAILLRATARDPAQRYPTAEALQQALEVFAQNAGLSLSPQGLARLMAELFAEELAPWHKAAQQGMTLEAFVTHGTHGTSVSDAPTTEWSFSAVTTKPRARPPPRTHPRPVLQIAMLIALFAAGYLGARWWLTAG